MSGHGPQGEVYSYPIQLPVQYLLSDRESSSGEGRTLAISSETVRFECDRALPVGRKIRLVLAWPAALPDGTALNLWISGTIARCAAGEIEVCVVTYEFRTRPHVRQMPGRSCRPSIVNPKVKTAAMKAVGREGEESASAAVKAHAAGRQG
jgi:hypothetical protein